MQYLIEANDSAGGAGVTRLFDPDRGCDTFVQRVLRFGPGLSGEQAPSGADEVLFVVEGEGELVTGDARSRLAPGVGAFVPAGSRWRASNEGEGTLAILSVLVPDPSGSLDTTACTAPSMSLTRSRTPAGASSIERSTPRSPAGPTRCTTAYPRASVARSMAGMRCMRS